MSVLPSPFTSKIWAWSLSITNLRPSIPCTWSISLNCPLPFEIATKWLPSSAMPMMSDNPSPFTSLICKMVCPTQKRRPWKSPISVTGVNVPSPLDNPIQCIPSWALLSPRTMITSLKPSPLKSPTKAWALITLSLSRHMPNCEIPVGRSINVNAPFRLFASDNPSQ